MSKYPKRSVFLTKDYLFREGTKRSKNANIVLNDLSKERTLILQDKLESLKTILKETCLRFVSQAPFAFKDLMIH
jgi:hypothetical protein